MGKLFRFLKGIFRHIPPKMEAVWEEPFVEEPSVFICNHMGAMGPVYMTIKFPLCDRVMAWCNDGVLDRKKCPDYVRGDFWWKPGCFLEPLYNVTLPYIAAAIIPPVLNSAPTIAVHHDARIMTTMRESMKALKEDKHLVIFPEVPSGYGTYEERINTGWLRLCTMYHRMTGKTLRIYPVHICPKEHAFYIGKAVVPDMTRPIEEQADAIADVLGAGLRGENRAK